MLDEGDRALRAARGNFGLIWVQGKGADFPAYAAWTGASARRWPELATRLREETGIDVAFDQRGGVHLCLSRTGARDTLCACGTRCGWRKWHRNDGPGRAARPAARYRSRGRRRVLLRGGRTRRSVATSARAARRFCRTWWQHPWRLCCAYRGETWRRVQADDRVGTDRCRARRARRRAGQCRARAATRIVGAGSRGARADHRARTHARVARRSPSRPCGRRTTGTVLAGDSQEQTASTDTSTGVLAAIAARAVRAFPRLVGGARRAMLGRHCAYSRPTAIRSTSSRASHRGRSSPPVTAVSPSPRRTRSTLRRRSRRARSRASLLPFSSDRFHAAAAA